MRRLALTAVLLFAIPSLSLAADAMPAAPPSPPQVSYDVWGFLWNGQQYVKQDTHSFSTFDVNKAEDYADQINGYAGWSATTNIPESAVVHKVYRGAGVTNVRPSAFPTPLTYSVWAYKLTDGKWVKDMSYSWTTQDPQLGLDYAAKVSAVPGWAATTNCPATVPAAQRYVDGGTIHGARSYTNRYSRSRAPGFNFSPDGKTVYLPWFNMAIRIPPGSHWNVNSGDSYDPTFDNSNEINDSINLQNQLATQDMINQQQMQNNLQDSLNTQNFINTENMINTQNDITNQQNAINQQNEINAMNP